MAELKTKKNDASVSEFINNIEDDVKRKDCKKILAIMKKVTKKKPKMWGTSIVGFGSYHYKYESGREGDWFISGFAPRKQALTLYIMAGFNRYDELMAKLGKHKTGKACLYVKKLEDIDIQVLEELIQASVNYMNDKYN